jgi:8-oxo-dGTP pyrophosphatase MutT (NUDIX family)
MNLNTYPAPKVSSVLSVKLIIANSTGDYLVLTRAKTDKNRPGSADLAGGGIDPGESPLEAGCREAWEELGIKLCAEQLGKTFCLEALSVFLHINERYFLPVVVESTPKLTLNPAEHSAGNWYPRDEAYGRLVHPSLREGFAVGTGILDPALI